MKSISLSRIWGFQPLLFRVALAAIAGTASLAGAQTPTAASAPAQASRPTKMTIAISSVKVTPSLAKEIASRNQSNDLGRVRESLDGQLNAAFSNSGKFDVIARSDLGDLKEEQDLSRSGVVDENDPNRARSGAVAGAKFIVVTSIDNFQSVVQSSNFEGVGTAATRQQVTLSAVVKIYDSSTGKVLHTASMTSEGASAVNNPAYVNSQRGGSLTDSAVADRAKDLSSKVVAQVTDWLLPARIISVSKTNAGEVTINRGEGSGIKVGEVWEVFGTGEDMVDPDTGESLGKSETRIGEIVIERITPKFSIGRVKDGAGDIGADKSCVVRKKAAGGGGKASPGAVRGSEVDPWSSDPPELPKLPAGTSAPTPSPAPGPAGDPVKSGPPYGAAIFVKNRCKQIDGDDVSKLEDLIVADLKTDCIRAVSREDVMNSVRNFSQGGPNVGTQGSVQAAAKTARDVYDILQGGTERYEDLDKALSDTASASQLSAMMGCEYVFLATLTSLDVQKKRFRSENMGLDVENVEFCLTTTYKVIDTSTGRVASSGKSLAKVKVENTPNLQESLTLTGPLFNQAAEQLAAKLNERCAAGQILAPTAPKAGGGIVVICSMQDLTVPDVRKDPETGAYTVTGNSFNMQPNPLSATVAVDGVTVGSAPSLDLAPLPASPGPHKVTVTRAGFKAWSKPVNVPADRPLQLTVALQLDDQGFARWRSNTAFLQGLKQGQQLTDAQVKVLEGMAETFRQSGYKVDYKVDTKQAPTTNVFGSSIWAPVP